MNLFRHVLRMKSRLVYLLLAVFVANIFAASAGIAVPFDWIEHERNHFAAFNGHTLASAQGSVPDQPANEQIKHDSHASHFFHDYVASDLVVIQPASPCSLPISYVYPVSGNTADLPFRPPR